MSVAGILPRYVWIARRVAEISAAIERHIATRIQYPVTWETELNNLLTSFATPETRDQVIRTALAEYPTPEVSAHNPHGLTLRVVATCDTLAEAEEEANKLILCTVAALCRTQNGKKFLRPHNSLEGTLCAYVVIVCDL